MKKLISITAAVLVCAALLPVLFGCASGNARLETGGAYARTNNAPDYAFYAIEVSYDLALSSFKTASRLEIDNRQLFWNLSPDIKHTLDVIRPQALAADRAYSKARAVYISNPTPAGLSGLQTLLGQFQQLAAAAVSSIPKEQP
jgi:hypothetical protein